MLKNAARCCRRFAEVIRNDLTLRRRVKVPLFELSGAEVTARQDAKNKPPCYVLLHTCTPSMDFLSPL
jgi:hypothetical protein